MYTKRIDDEYRSDMVSAEHAVSKSSDEVEKGKKSGKVLKRLVNILPKKWVPAFIYERAHGEKANNTRTVRAPMTKKIRNDENGAESTQSRNIHGGTEVVQVTAQFSYEAFNDGDISFKKGDILEVDTDAMSNPYCEWCTARHLGTGLDGYIPRNYVAEDNNSPYSQEWYYNISRSHTQRLLSNAVHPVGTFLVRGDFAFVLSIKSSNQGEVKNYRIRRTDEGEFYISPRKVFENVLQLVSHYTDDADCLCCKLTEPVPKKKPFVHLRNLEVDRKSVVLMEKFLGMGHYGDTHAGILRNTLDVAVKRLKQNLVKTPADNLFAGMEIINKLRHEKLVQILAVCTRTEPVLIVSEFMANGSLLEYLRREDVRASLRLESLTDIAAQIAEGMAYLEEKTFIHGDLWAAKCLVGCNNEVKVANYGLYQLLKDPDELSIWEMSNCLPIKWFAPEVLLFENVSTKSDVWSYGVLLFEIFTFGSVPYPGFSGVDVLDRIEKGYRMPKPACSYVKCPDEYYETMLKCWNKTPECRPNFAYLQQFFEDNTVATRPSTADT